MTKICNADEEWKYLEEYELKYMISNYGRIISFVRYSDGKLLNIKKVNHKGYKRINLNGDFYLVHCLVAKYFIPNINSKPQVNHKDGIKTNNYYKNLEWVTNQENRDHAVINDLIARGEEQPNHKLCEQDIKVIFDLNKKGLKLKQIAEMFPVSKQIISGILRRERWKHVKID